MAKTSLLIILFILAACSPLFANELSHVQTPTKRMLAIQEKFSLTIAAIFRSEGEADHWLFVKIIPGSSFKAIPVLTPESATDKQVKEAIMCASSCAAFYEYQIKQTLMSTPQAFVMPTHPNDATWREPFLNLAPESYTQSFHSRLKPIRK